MCSQGPAPLRSANDKEAVERGDPPTVVLAANGELSPSLWAADPTE